MKKYLLSMAILMAVAISAKAQLSVGVKGGVNLSEINTSNLNESTRTGYQVGLFARAGSDWYFQPELYLASKGGKFDFDTDNDGVIDKNSGKINFTTLNVPLLVGKSFGSKDLNFRLMAGPVYSYYMNRSDNFSTNISSSFKDFNKNNIGYQAGAGVDIAAVTVDLRYEGGLTKINSTFNERPSIWALSVGFKIF